MSRTVTVSRSTETETEVEVEKVNPVLQFDFKGRPVPPATPAQSKRDDSIKQAIIRWLNEQL